MACVRAQQAVYSAVHRSQRGLHQSSSRLEKSDERHSGVSGFASSWSLREVGRGFARVVLVGLFSSQIGGHESADKVFLRSYPNPIFET